MHSIHRHKKHESLLVAGGFPCQDASKANRKGKGIDGQRTGMGWAEMRRIICLIKPEYVFIENVPNLLNRGWGKVLGQLAAGGYRIWYRVIPAKNFGFPFEGERLYAVAFSSGCVGWEEIQYFNERFEEKIQRFKTQNNPAGITDRAFWGDAYPEFLRKDNGLPAGSYRITALGNACIPLFPEIILSALNDLDHFINTRPA